MFLERVFQALDDLHDTASANAVFGEPREVEGRVLIPVAAVGIGFGIGGGQAAPPEEQEESGEEVQEEEQQEANEGGGGGGGASARPIAVIEVTPEQTVIRPIINETRVALAGIALVGWIFCWLMVTLMAIFGKHE